MKHVSLRLDWLPSGYHSIFHYGLDKGFFAKEGIDLDIQDGKGSGGTIQSIAAGQDDFGFAALPVLAAGADKITNVKMVCGIIEKTPNAIISLSTSGIQSPQDLTGKTQGFTPGGETVPAAAIERVNGVDPGTIKRVSVAAGAEIAALLTHKVDFINEWAFDEGLQVKKEDPGAHIMLFADYGVEVMGSGLIVNTSTINDDPNLVQSMVKALQESMEATVADPDAAVQSLLKARPTAPDTSLANLESSIDFFKSPSTQDAPYCTMSDEDVRSTQDILQNYGGLSPSVSVASVVDNEFVR